ncbi:unnamed protein product [Lepeophtheirus salmonis]|uniref:(salmon louse) hypothetical protein n=1 Tax=Lepeophtheirus salmonis TaxID=72036 RepID=A0A7R8D724_LEPSM|nr:unnamed protein product [Lepeophtheirus salmonis]CAF2995933.1 unnamed protein product [Lepeophtheirus salmonis]
MVILLSHGISSTKEREACSNILPDEEFRVFLTMNAKASVNWKLKTKVRLIELNWTLAPEAKTIDWVGLFRRDPMIKFSHPIVGVSAFGFGGYFLTRFKFPKYPFHGMKSPQSTCLYGYWIGYISGNRTLKSNCLKLQPNWMWEDKDLIGSVPLNKLMIPGSHNSGSYLDFLGLSRINIIYRYTVNQGEDVWNQLLYGIRYLDIRVGYYKDTPEKFWVVHDFVRMNPLYEVLSDVRRFLQRTNEIVIMDFHRFPTGFEEGGMQHSELVRFLTRELGEFMAPDWIGRNVSMNDLWRINRTLILTYAHYPSSAYNNIIWSEVPQSWADEGSVLPLKKFLKREMNKNSKATYFWAAMTHLTTSPIDIVLNLNGGLRELSDKIARQVNIWYRVEWWDEANIVATDFFLGNNIIEESIIANRKRVSTSGPISSLFSKLHRLIIIGSSLRSSLSQINSRKDNKYNGIEDEDEDSKKWDLERNKSPLKSRISNKKVNMKLTQDNIMEWFLLSATGTNKSKEYYSSLLDKQMKDTLQQKEIDSN